ncbi:hypothetical protein [Streptomyces hygroscopicus]|uniref:hypothetical protein n=1 Tax=Streptomyces hygroscopicus TaxID=1912 RepID=UPI0022406D5D|nr:hypothetical protein [Streptomyces hygroscopicus]
MDPELLERITARRAELDEIEEQLAKQLAEVRAERDELAVAERVLERVSEQLADERASVAPAPGQVGGRAVMLIPRRTPDMPPTTSVSTPSTSHTSPLTSDFKLVEAQSGSPWIGAGRPMRRWLWW